MGNESVGSSESWQFVKFKVEGDVHVDYVMPEIGRITGLGMDADRVGGTIRVYVPPTRSDEVHLIKDRVLNGIEGLSFVEIQDGK